MRFCLKLLACLLLWVGFVAPLTAAAAQVEIAVERPSSNGTAEPVFIAQTNATPGPVVTALPVEEDFDDPDEAIVTASRTTIIDDVTFTCVFTPSTGVPDATLSQVGKPPENAVLL
ncbi:MAG: hypothetical protein DMD91_25365 [Candidatus Rokuibacteriota bacterium]|nr:MAG: hypothetical protein DMD91_25365 [Candidatus Rokubacteria bacterium]